LASMTSILLGYGEWVQNTNTTIQFISLISIHLTSKENILYLNNISYEWYYLIVL
jgi:hypothetical protein